MLIGGGLGLAAGAVSLLLPVFRADCREPRFMTFLLVSGAMYAAAGWVCLRPALRASAYALVISDAGFRTLADAPGTLIPWSRVAGLRERHIGHRVELLDHQGRTLARLEYQLAGFDEAMAMVLARSAFGQRRLPLPQRFATGKPLLTALLVVPLVALVIWAMLHGRALLGAVLLGLLAWDFIKGRRGIRRELVVEPDRVRLATAANAVVVPTTDIQDVRLVRRPIGNGAMMLDVVVVTTAGTAHLARPGAADAFAIYLALKTAAERAVPARRTHQAMAEAGAGPARLGRLAPASEGSA